MQTVSAMPALARMAVIAGAIGPGPQTWILAARRRARMRAPPSVSPWASAASASSGASRVRSAWLSARSVPVGWSSSAPPAASNVSM